MNIEKLIFSQKEGEGMADLLVRDLMHLGVVTCNVGVSICEVAQSMVDNAVHCVVVLDEAGEACGVISDLDLTKFYGREIKSLTAEDVLEGNVIIVDPNAPISAAMVIMLEKHIHHLVIMSEPPLHRPIGVLAASDVVKKMAESCGIK